MSPKSVVAVDVKVPHHCTQVQPLNNTKTDAASDGIIGTVFGVSGRRRLVRECIGPEWPYLLKYMDRTPPPPPPQ